MSGFNWFWNILSSKEAKCLCCEKPFPKVVMKEIMFPYTEENGKTGVSSVYVCELCLAEIANNLDDIAEDLDRIGNE